MSRGRKRNKGDVDKVAEYEDKDKESPTIIDISVAYDIVPYVKDLGTSGEAWDKLKAFYENPNASRVFYLRNQFYYLRKDEGDSATYYLTRPKNITDQLIVWKQGLNLNNI